MDVQNGESKEQEVMGYVVDDGDRSHVRSSSGD